MNNGTTNDAERDAAVIDRAVAALDADTETIHALRESGERHEAAVRGLDRATRIFAVAVVAYAASALLLVGTLIRLAGCRAGWWAC